MPSFVSILIGLVSRRQHRLSIGNDDRVVMNAPSKAPHAPLHLLDSEKQTYGCRHTNPNVCGKNSVPSICAFVRKDNICLSPPTSWKKQYQKLFVQQFQKQKQKRRD
jgi:hypothetical protein